MITTMKQLLKKSSILLGVFVLLVIFTRFYNLDGTARFTRDESSDLARMYQYYQNKQLSLVGPISSEGDKVFSSLSYYLIMPFAIALNFTPVSPVYGMAFLGVITAIILLLLVHKINKKYLLLAGTLIIIWFPLVLASRWAWNPHFVIFWAALALLIYEYRKKFGWISYIIVGISFGAMFHHHYVAIFTTAPFLFLISLPLFKKRQYKEIALLFIGYLLPHLIFVLFDLKNPPGLFFGRYLLGGNTPVLETSLTPNLILGNLMRNISIYLQTFVQNTWLQIIFGILLFTLIIRELKTQTLRTFTWILPATMIIFAGVFLNDFQIRYVLSSVAFIFVWLILPRKDKINQLLVKFIIIVLTFGSALTIKSQLTVTDVPPSPRVIAEASQIIIDTIKDEKLNNANVAALASPEDAPLAEKYRDYIRMRGTGLRAPSEYDVSEHLFVISTGSDEILREDKSYAMIAFKDKKLRDVFNIDSQWKVFWYGTE